MNYKQTVTIQSDGKALLETAMQLLMAQSFSIIKKESFYLEVIAGVEVHSSNQNPILGASKIILTVSGRQLTVSAQLDGYKKLIRILSIMMVVMAIGFVAMAYFLPNEGSDYKAYYAAAPLLPWVFLMPMLGKIFKKRTVKALDTFVTNLTMINNN